MIVTLPEINYITVRGKGNPNEEEGEYKQALELLYGVAYALKMSYKSDYKIDGFFQYVVPPLEGLWWTECGTMDYNDKINLYFISMIRLPDFVTNKDLEWAIREMTKKEEKGLLESRAVPLRRGSVCTVHARPILRRRR